MALSVTELRLIERLIARFTYRPKMLLLGYPDVLADKGAWVGHRLAWDMLPKRSNPSELWISHNRAHLKNEDMLETKGILTALGADVLVSDAIAWGEEDFILDLNERVAIEHRNRFDLVIDPGTLEHCFNIAQAFENIDLLLRPSGFVYHQDAVSFPNHGFWSISPTTFFDFYEMKGYELGRPYRFGNPIDSNGHMPRLLEIHPFEPLQSGQIIGSYAFRKSSLAVQPAQQTMKFPIQRIYSSNSRELTLVDFFDLTDLGI